LLKSSFLLTFLGAKAPATAATPLAISVEIRFTLNSNYRGIIRDFNKVKKPDTPIYVFWLLRQQTALDICTLFSGYTNRDHNRSSKTIAGDNRNSSELKRTSATDFPVF